jgi:hypothetical protein
MYVKEIQTVTMAVLKTCRRMTSGVASTVGNSAGIHV